MRVKPWKAFLFFLPFLIVFLLFWALPFITGVVGSMYNYRLGTNRNDFVGLQNYETILFSESRHHDNFFLGLGNTLIFVGISVIPLVIICLLLALLLDRVKDPWKKVFRTLFFMSYAVSVTAVSAIFIWMLNGPGSYINVTLSRLGIISAESPIGWLSEQPFAWLSILGATIWWTVGFNMMLFVNALNEIDTQLYEASSIDGASYPKQFRYIIMPSIIHTFWFVLLNTTIASFNLYGQSYLITRGGPGQSTSSLSLQIYRTIMENKNLSVGMAMAILMGFVVMLFCMAQYLLTQRKKDYMEVRK